MVFFRHVLKVLFLAGLLLPSAAGADWGAPFCDIDSPDQFQKAVDAYESGLVDSDTGNANCNVIRVRKGMTIPLPKGLLIRDKYAAFGLEVRPCYADSTYKGDGCTEPVGDDAVVLDFSDYKDVCPIRVRYGAEALLKRLRLIVRGDKSKAICQEGSLTPIVVTTASSPYVTKLEKITIDEIPEVTPPPPPGKEGPPICKLKLEAVKGEEFTLSWESSGAETVTLREGERTLGTSPTGSVTDKPSPSSTGKVIYRLTCTGSGGASAESKIEVKLKPTCSLEGKINLPEGYKLKWKTTNAPKTTLKDDEIIGSFSGGEFGPGLIVGNILNKKDGKNLTEGEIVVNPERDTTYTLTGNGPGGSCEKELTLTPNLLPPRCDLEAKAATDGGYDLLWSTFKVTDATLQETIGEGPAKTISTDLNGKKGVAKATVPITYTLKGKGPAGECFKELTLAPRVTELLPPKCEFKAAPATGGGFDLIWSTKGAKSVTVGEEGKPPISTLPENPVPPPNVKPTAATTYVLKGENGVGGICLIKIPLAPAPVIPTLPPPPECDVKGTALTAGGFELTWTSKDATTVTISDGSPTPIATSLTSPTPPPVVKPAVTTIYTITAKGTGGVCSKGVPLSPPFVPPVVPTCSLESKEAASGGFELVWSTKDATTAAVSDGSATPLSTLPSSDPKSPLIVKPAKPTTYAVAAKGAGGSCKSEKTLSPPPPPTLPAPACLSFTADLPAADRSVALKWETKNAKKVTLTEGASSSKEVEKSGTAKVTPTSPTVYKISATGDGEPCSTAITVSPEKKDPLTGEGPSCDLRGGTQAGGGFELVWSTKGAVTITVSDGSTTPLSTAASGKLGVRPPAPTLYTLTAANADGNCVSKLTLSPGALSGGGLPPPPTCNLTSTVAFGGGFDLAWSTTGATTVVFGDGAAIPLSTAPSGKINVKPTTAVTYTVTATDAGGSCSKSLFPADLSLSFVEGGGSGGCSLTRR